MPTFFRIFAVVLCVTILTAAASAADVQDANDLSMRKCMQVDAVRSLAIREGKEVEWSPLDLACLRYAIAQRKLARSEIALANLSDDERVARCITAFFSIVPDGTQYQLRYEGHGCGTVLRCTIHITLSATDGTRHEALEEYASGLARIVTHESGRWLALQHGQFNCRVENS